MSRLAESLSGNLYPARGEPGGMNRNSEDRVRCTLMMGSTYLMVYQVLGSNGKILGTLEELVGIWVI